MMYNIPSLTDVRDTPLRDLQNRAEETVTPDHLEGQAWARIAYDEACARQNVPSFEKAYAATRYAARAALADIYQVDPDESLSKAYLHSYDASTHTIERGILAASTTAARIASLLNIRSNPGYGEIKRARDWRLEAGRYLRNSHHFMQHYDPLVAEHYKHHALLEYLNDQYGRAGFLALGGMACALLSKRRDQSLPDAFPSRRQLVADNARILLMAAFSRNAYTASRRNAPNGTLYRLLGSPVHQGR